MHLSGCLILSYSKNLLILVSVSESASAKEDILCLQKMILMHPFIFLLPHILVVLVINAVDLLITDTVLIPRTATAIIAFFTSCTY